MKRRSVSKILQIDPKCSDLDFAIAIYLERIGQHIQWYREKMFYVSQNEFARITKIPQSKLFKLENGALDLRMSTLIKIANTLGAYPGELLPGPYAVVDRARLRGRDLEAWRQRG